MSATHTKTCISQAPKAKTKNENVIFPLFLFNFFNPDGNRQSLTPPRRFVTFQLFWFTPFSHSFHALFEVWKHCIELWIVIIYLTELHLAFIISRKWTFDYLKPAFEKSITNGIHTAYQSIEKKISPYLWQLLNENERQLFRPSRYASNPLTLLGGLLL